MKIIKTLITILSIFISSLGLCESDTNFLKPIGDKNNLDQFGFGPAFYLLSYDDEVLQDSKDVKKLSNNIISAAGSSYSTTIGLEVHYGFSFFNKACCLINDKKPKNGWESSSGHVISPFLGLFDLTNGINGGVIGVLYGYWKGDGKFKNRTSLNVGIGRFVHKNRLVLSNGVKEGSEAPEILTVEEYTERKDIKGTTIMISASLGF